MPKDERPPYFNFYVDDFVSDGNVEAMTTEEVGAYILLLCKAWREVPIASIPNDDRTLSRWARMTPDQWADIKEMVLRPFTRRNDGRLYQKRLCKEYEKLRDSIRRKSEAATSAANARWGKSLYADALQTHCEGNADGMLIDAISESEPNIKDSPSENKTPKPPLEKVEDFFLGVPVPAVLNTSEFREAWSEWHQHKREIKNKLTPLAVKKALKALCDIGPARAVAAIEVSIRGGWKGIFEETKNANNRPSRNPAAGYKPNPAQTYVAEPG